MRIAQIITRLDWGGAPDIVRILGAGLARAGHEVVLISGPLLHPSHRMQEFLAGNAVRHIVIPALQRDIHLGRDFVALAQLWRVLQREQCAIAHTHTAKAGALGRMAARLAGIPNVYHTAHGHNFYGYFSPWFSRVLIMIERFLTGITTRLLVLTQAEKDDCIAFRVARQEKITIIGTALEEFPLNQAARQSLRNEFGVADDIVLVGMVGRLEPIKGPDLFLEAAAMIAAGQPQARFVLIGEGSLRQALEERSLQGILNGRVQFAGWREDARECMRALDILVLPSRNEAVGLVLLEAQAQGIPVVATRVGGTPDVIRDSETGLLVLTEDAPALAAAIIRLVADRALRQQLGRRGKQWVQEKFSCADFIQRVTSAYVDHATSN